MKNRTEVLAHLQELYRAFRSDLGDFPWEYESDRWNEFVICLWIGALQIDAQSARDGLARLVAIGWRDPIHWSNLDTAKREIGRHALITAGIDKDSATEAVEVAANAASGVVELFGNDLHLILRRAGEKMVPELLGLLA